MRSAPQQEEQRNSAMHDSGDEERMAQPAEHPSLPPISQISDVFQTQVEPHKCRRTRTEAVRHTDPCGQAKARKEIPHRKEISKECQAPRKDPIQWEAPRKKHLSFL